MLIIRSDLKECPTYSQSFPTVTKRVSFPRICNTYAGPIRYEPCKLEIDWYSEDERDIFIKKWVIDNVDNFIPSKQTISVCYMKNRFELMGCLPIKYMHLTSGNFEFTVVYDKLNIKKNDYVQA